MAMGPRFRVAFVGISAILGASSPTKPALVSSAAYTVARSGQAESASAEWLAGDLDGSGQVRLTVDLASQRICYDFRLSHLATPLMAHIHKGPALSTGPSVVTLFTRPGGKLGDCLPWTEKWLAEIVAQPSDFYVNLYTTEFPDGAVRGQLES